MNTPSCSASLRRSSDGDAATPCAERSSATMRRARGRAVPARMVEAQDEGEQVERERQHPQEAARSTMFCVTWLVTASSITEPVAASASHSSCTSARAAPGVRLACRVCVVDRASRCATIHAVAGAEQRKRARTAIDQPQPALRVRSTARTAPDKPSSASSDAKFDSANRRYGTALGKRRQNHACTSGWSSTAGSTAGRWSRRGAAGSAQIGSSSPRGFQPRRAMIGRQASDTHQQRDVQQRLPRARPARVASVGVGVAGEQHALEEHEARRPDRGRAAEPRQDLLGDDRLDQEQQERRKEDRRRVRQRGYQGIRSC